MAFSQEENALIRQSLLAEGRRRAVTVGMRKTSVEQLTEAAGISKGSFYKYFESKEMLFLAVLILPAVHAVLKEGGQVACLVKPQFEAGREKVGKKGVVRDPAVHLEVLEHFQQHVKDSGFTLLGLTYSPIRGPEGNIEYLGYLRKGVGREADVDLAALVAESHEALRQHGEGNE